MGEWEGVVTGLVGKCDRGGTPSVVDGARSSRIYRVWWQGGDVCGGEGGDLSTGPASVERLLGYGRAHRLVSPPS